MYMCVRGVDFSYLNDFSIEFLNCSDNVAFFVFHYIQELNAFFVVLLACSASYKMCFGPRFYTHIKLQKNAFNSYNYI
jgi:predicted ATP-grasp superfamily ATP-dependent carboligase